MTNKEIYFETGVNNDRLRKIDHPSKPDIFEIDYIKEFKCADIDVLNNHIFLKTGSINILKTLNSAVTDVEIENTDDVNETETELNMIENFINKCKIDIDGYNQRIHIREVLSTDILDDNEMDILEKNAISDINNIEHFKDSLCVIQLNVVEMKEHIQRYLSCVKKCLLLISDGNRITCRIDQIYVHNNLKELEQKIDILMNM